MGAAGLWRALPITLRSLGLALEDGNKELLQFFEQKSGLSKAMLVHLYVWGQLARENPMHLCIGGIGSKSSSIVKSRPIYIAVGNEQKDRVLQEHAFPLSFASWKATGLVAEGLGLGCLVFALSIFCSFVNNLLVLLD